MDAAVQVYRSGQPALAPSADVRIARSFQDARAEPADESEAYKELLSCTFKKTGSIPEDVISKHIIEVTRGGGWPVAREAMEALLRRFSFAKRDGLEVTSCPPGDRIPGRYRTHRKGLPARPYQTTLESVDPPRGSCDCPDFLRSSLGLCKHLLVILDHWYSRPRKLKAALAAEQARSFKPTWRFRWDPVRPLIGAGDWMERMRWEVGAELAERDGVGLAVRRRWFAQGPDGSFVLKDTFAARHGERLRLVRDLRKLIAGGPSGRPTPGTCCDPALLVLLRLEEDRLDRLASRPWDAARLRGALHLLKQRLYPYQREGVMRFLEAKRLLLADDMGLGKTAQAIAGCHALWHSGEVRRGLIIVPASLKPQWHREWQTFTDVPAAVVDGNAQDRRAAFQKCKEGFLIANYEQLLRDLEIMHRWKPDIVVLDEAQRIKNWATKTATYVKELRPPYRLVLTGTPMENRLDELASILEWVDDMALEPRWRLTPWHSTYVDGRKEIGGARNLDTLRARISHCFTRRIRKEVLQQLPARTDTDVPIEMTQDQREEHAALDQPIAQLVSIARKRPLTQAQFLRLMSLLTTQRIISNGMAQYRFEEMWPAVSRLARPTDAFLKSLSSPKLIEFREHIGQIVLQQKRKVVVFSQWLRMLRLSHWAVRDILAETGLRAVFFTGEESQKRRTQNIVDFHDDPDARILFASDAGGVGLNLQRAANCCINLELPWNPAVLEQRIGRIYRIGQKHPIDVYNLVCSEGIEARIFTLVGCKKALFTGLFDGTSNEITFERSGSFLSRLEKIVDPIKVPDFKEDGAEDGSEEEMERLLAQADEASDAKAAEVKAIEAPAAEPEKREEARISSPEARGPAELPSPTEVRKLFSQLQVRPTEGGGIAIEAPPDAASSLAALFEGMARLLQGAAKN